MNISSFRKTYLNKTYIRDNRFMVVFTASLIFVILVAVGIRIIKATQSSEVAVQIPVVTLQPLSSFKQEKALVINNGTVESLQQAELRSQSSAPVSAIRATINQEVSAGQILVTLKNNDVVAQLKQAEAGLAMQKANLDSLIKGARAEDLALSKTDLNQATSGVDAQYKNAVTLINDSYTKANDVLFKQIASLILYPESQTPQLSFSTNNADAAIDVGVKRKQIQDELKVWRNELDVLTFDNQIAVDSSLTKTKNRLLMIVDLLNRLGDALGESSGAPNGDLVGARSNVNTARSTVNGVINGVVAQTQAITSAKLSAQRAEQGITLKEAGGTDDQVAAQRAVVAQAEAGVAALQAQVEKTIIRAPVSGKVATLPVRVGELVSPGQLIAAVVNTNAIQVKTFISGSDVAVLSEGDDALIADSVKGKVLRVAPSVDAQTKKAEVDIVVIDEKQTTIVVGQTVDVKIFAKKLADGLDAFMVPLSAVRVSSNGSFLFSVDDKGVVKEIPVQTGALAGERIQIVEGVSPDTQIIVLARGIKGGDVVKIGTLTTTQ